MKKLESSNIPIELENRDASIFIIDQDVQLLKKLGNEILQNYPSYQVVACDNITDFNDELISQRVSVFIVEINKETEESSLNLIRSIRGMSLYQKTSLMVLATREVLERNSTFLKTMGAEIIPKAIRMPFFMGVLQSCLSRENTVEIETIEYKDGELLFKEGDLPTRIFVTKSGELEVFQIKDNDEFVLGVIGVHEVVGEMAFLKKEKRSASVRARGNCVVLAIELANIEFYIQSQPFWLQMILGSLTKRIDHMNKRVRDLSS